MKLIHNRKCMKQILFILSVLLFLQVIYVPALVQAASSTSSSEYTYDTTAGGKVIIKKYNGSSKNPVVPGIIKGKTVTGLGNGAFLNKPVTSVTLPDSIKTIGDDVFAGTKITELILPPGVTSIGKNLLDDRWGIVVKSDSTYVEQYITKYFFKARFEPLSGKMASYHKVTFKTNGNGQIVKNNDIRYLGYASGIESTVMGGTDGWYKEGTNIILNAKPDAGYGVAFNVWTVSGAGTLEGEDSKQARFTMAGSDVVLTANFEEDKKPDASYKNGELTTFIGSGDFSVAETYQKSDTNKTKVPTISISSSAFDSYRGVGDPTTITLPTTIKKIWNGTFCSCSNLETIIVKEPNNSYTSVDGVLFNNDKTVLLAYPAGKKDKKYSIPDTVVEIAAYAFANNTYLENVTFSKKLKTIGDSAFMNAQSLKEINLPDSIKTVGAYAFRRNDNLKKVTIGAGVTSIGYGALMNCSSLENIMVSGKNGQYKSDSGVLYEKKTSELIVYPRKRAGDQYTILSGTKSIGGYAFEGSFLKTIKIPSSVVTLNQYAFNNCAWLTSITFPSGVKKLPRGVLSNCKSLKSISLPSGLTSIERYAFWNCGSLTSIIIPSSITSIANGVFYGCKSLTEIKLAKGNKKYAVENGVLYNASLTGLLCYPAAKKATGGIYKVKEGVKSVEPYAFAYSSLKEIELPETVDRINYGAFAFSNNVTITIRNKHISFNEVDTLNDAYDSVSLFWGTNTSKIMISGYLDSDAELYAWLKGIMFKQLEKATEGLIINNAGEVVGYTGKDTVITIPSVVDVPKKGLVRVTAIGENAFKDPENKDSRIYEQITEVKIPATVHTIKASAFDGCKSLKAEGLKLPLSLVTIGSLAFRNCSSLTEISIPTQVTEIATDAFDGCTSLTNISLQYIKGYNFSNKKFSSQDGILVLKEDKKNTIYRVPPAFSGEKGSYKIPDTIKEYYDLEPVIGLYDGALKGCSKITSVTVPESVASIGKNVFSDCKNLTDVYVYSKDVVYSMEDDIFTQQSDGTYKVKLHGYSGSTTESYAKEKNITFVAMED